MLLSRSHTLPQPQPPAPASGSPLRPFATSAPSPRARLVPATRVRVRGARPRSAPPPPPRGGVRPRAARDGGGGAGEATPCRPHLLRALRREGRLPQLCALRAGSHPGQFSPRLFILIIWYHCHSWRAGLNLTGSWIGAAAAAAAAAALTFELQVHTTTLRVSFGSAPPATPGVTDYCDDHLIIRIPSWAHSSFQLEACSTVHQHHVLSRHSCSSLSISPCWMLMIYSKISWSVRCRERIWWSAATTLTLLWRPSRHLLCRWPHVLGFSCLLIIYNISWIYSGCCPVYAIF